MTKLNGVYKCNICGNIVEILHEGAESLVCCGQPMQLLTEKKEDQGKEKHLPVIKIKEGKIFVKVGEIPHPMEKEHYIEFIEIISNGKVYKKFLKPGDKPAAEFCIKSKEITVREYCNIHGLWRKEV